MLNLDAEAVAEWLTERDPDAATAWLPPATSLREDTASLLRQLGNALDAAQAREPQALSRQLQEKPQSEKLRTLLAHIDRPTRMRLLTWLGEPPMPERDLVVRACLAGEGPADGSPLRQEIQHICRQTLLRRIFDRGRIVHLFEACKEAGQAGEAA